MQKVLKFLNKYDFPIHLCAIGRFVVFRILRWWYTTMARVKLILNRCDVGSSLLVDGPVWVRVEKKGSIRLGKQVTMLSRYGANLVGLTMPVTLVCGSEGKITVGNFSGMSGAVISSCSSITIGSYAKLGGNVRIYDHDFHSLDFCFRRGKEDKLNVNTRPVVIGDDVFIGANSIILKGVHIGDRVIVGAGSVVTRDIPPDEIWAGNPARFVKKQLERA